MVAYANREALERTLSTGLAHYFSRSRKTLWRKGETSGHEQAVAEIRLDCDGDTVLYRVEQPGPPATPAPAPASRRPARAGRAAPVEGAGSGGHLLSRLAATIAPRASERPAGSYTARLLDCRDRQGLAEGGRGGGRGGRGRERGGCPSARVEAADLLYHLLVLLQARGVPLDAVWQRARRQREPLGHGLRPSPHPQRVLAARRGQPDPRSGRRTSRSSAWTAWRSPTTATCTRPGRSTRRPRAQKIRPILGFEAYLAFGPRQAREKPAWAPGGLQPPGAAGQEPGRLPEPVRLTSIGYTEGFYRRPRIDKEVLEQHGEGIVCLAACLSGEVALHLRQGKYDEAKTSAEWFARMLRPRRVLARDPAARDRRGAAGRRRDAPAGQGAGRRRGRHQRRALPAAGGRRGARRAARDRDRAATSTTRSDSASRGRNRT